MAVPPILHAEHNVVREMRNAGALDPSSARPLTDLRLMEERAVERLLARGVVRESQPGTYWLDESAYTADHSARRRRAIIILIVLAIVVAALVALGIVRT